MSNVNLSEVTAFHIVVAKMGPKETILALIGHYTAKFATTEQKEYLHLANGLVDLVPVAKTIKSE